MRRLMALCAAALVALALGGAALAQGLPEVRLGNEAFREGDFARAVSHYTNAIRSGELVGEALAITYNNRGVAHGEAGNFDPAIADYSQALALRPNDATTIRNLRVAFVRRGELEFASGAYDDAVADFGEAIALEPDHHLAYQRRGEVYTELGLLDRAIADLEQAVVLSPSDSEVVLALNRAIEQRDQVAGTLGDDETPAFSPPGAIEATPADSPTATTADAAAPPSETTEPETGPSTTAVATEAPPPAEPTVSAPAQAEVAAAEQAESEPAAAPEPEPASGPAPETVAEATAPPEPEQVIDMTQPSEPAEATASASIEAPAPEPRPEGAEGAPYRVVSAVNYRAGPENDAARLGTIDAGRIVRVTNDTLGWKHVILPNGDRGFIYKNWLEPVAE